MKIGEEGWQAEVAVGVRALLSNAVWVQSAYCVPGEGTPDCYCLLGAVIHVMFPEQFLNENDRPPTMLEDQAADFIAEACPQFANGNPTEFRAQPIIDWNDSSRTKWIDVDAVVDQLVEHYALERRA